MAGYQHDEANGAPPNILGSVFPGRYVYQRMDAAVEGQAADVDMTELNSSHHDTTKSGTIVNPSVAMDPISPATAPNSRSGTSYGAEDVSPITPAGQSEVAQSPGGFDLGTNNAPSAAPAVRRPSRKSRFTELLRRSLSSSVSSNDGRGSGSRSLSGFETTREMTQQDTSYNPARSQSSAHQLDPINENETPGNRDDADNFSLKYSMCCFQLISSTCAC